MIIKITTIKKKEILDIINEITKNEKKNVIENEHKKSTQKRKEKNKNKKK